jgi:hypothetical protein
MGRFCTVPSAEMVLTEAWHTLLRALAVKLDSKYMGLALERGEPNFRIRNHHRGYCVLATSQTRGAAIQGTLCGEGQKLHWPLSWGQSFSLGGCPKSLNSDLQIGRGVRKLGRRARREFICPN